MTLGKCHVTDNRPGSLSGTTVIWRMKVLTEERAVTKEECVCCTAMAVLNLVIITFTLIVLNLSGGLGSGPGALFTIAPCFWLASELHPSFPEIIEKTLP